MDKDSIDIIREEIETGIVENVLDEKESQKILTDVNTLGELYTDRIRNIKKLAHRKIEELENELDDKVREMEKLQENATKRTARLKSFIIIRECLNKRFNNYWRESEEKIQVAPEILNTYSHGKIYLHDNAGFKFAVYMISTQDNISQKVSKDLCRFYLQLNGKFHPDAVSNFVEAIEELRHAVHEGDDLCREFGITDKMLNEIEN